MLTGTYRFPPMDSVIYGRPFAEVVGDQVRLRVVSFQGGTPRRGEAKRGLKESTALGEELAATLRE